MCDREHGARIGEIADGPLDKRVSLKVHRCRRFVQDENLARSDQRSSQGDELPLSLTQIATARRDRRFESDTLRCRDPARAVPSSTETRSSQSVIQRRIVMLPERILLLSDGAQGKLTRLKRNEPDKSTGSWGMMVMLDLSALRLRFSVFIPSITTLPLVGIILRIASACHLSKAEVCAPVPGSTFHSPSGQQCRPSPRFRCAH